MMYAVYVPCYDSTYYGSCVYIEYTYMHVYTYMYTPTTVHTYTPDYSYTIVYITLIYTVIHV